MEPVEFRFFDTKGGIEISFCSLNLGGTELNHILSLGTGIVVVYYCDWIHVGTYSVHNSNTVLFVAACNCHVCRPLLSHSSS